MGHIRPLSHSDEAKLILAALKPARLQPVGPLQNLMPCNEEGKERRVEGILVPRMSLRSIGDFTRPIQVIND